MWNKSLFRHRERSLFWFDYKMNDLWPQSFQDLSIFLFVISLVITERFQKTSTGKYWKLINVACGRECNNRLLSLKSSIVIVSPLWSLEWCTLSVLFGCRSTFRPTRRQRYHRVTRFRCCTYSTLFSYFTIIKIIISYIILLRFEKPYFMNGQKNYLRIHLKYEYKVEKLTAHYIYDLFIKEA